MGRLQIGERFPHRPGYGTKGQKVVLWANYFQLIPRSDLVLYRYHVNVQPAVTGRKLGQIIKLLLEIPGYTEYRAEIVTDFRSTLISCRRLGSDPAEFRIKYKAEGEDEPLENSPEYRLRVEETGILTVAELTDYLANTNSAQADGDKLPILQALNIYLAHHAKASPNTSTVGSSKSFSLSQDASQGSLGAGLNALRGFFSSVRVATCRILVNVNVSHAAFYDAIPLDQLIVRYGQRTPIKIEKFIKKVRVRTTHLPEKKNKAGEIVPRIKTIFGLARTDDGRGQDKPPQVSTYGAGPKLVKFFLKSSSATSSASTAQAGGKGEGKKKGKGKKSGPSKDGPGEGSAEGSYITVYDFFKTCMSFPVVESYALLIIGLVHGYTVPDNQLTMPVVNLGNHENPSYLPAGVCIVMPGQNSGAKLSPAQTQQMINVAVRKPWQNANSISGEGPKVVGLLPQDNASMVRTLSFQ